MVSHDPISKSIPVNGCPRAAKKKLKKAIWPMINREAEKNVEVSSFKTNL
jgi:hypothetical protein